MRFVTGVFWCLMAFNSVAFADGSSWVIQKDRWSVTDEKNYSDFIARLGESGCNNVNRCLKSSSNPYRATDPAGIVWRSDCAEYPYFLRAYFAWKNYLPFSYVSAVKPAGSSTDLRYSPDGNIPTGRHDVVTPSSGKSPQAPNVIEQMLSDMNSAMFRVHPQLDSQHLFSDFYSVAINRSAIRPGTMIYDPAGHVATVYKVEDDGRISYFDAHPDNSVSHSIYGQKFERSRPGQGAGFKNWRPLILIGAQSTPNGFLGGHIEAVGNDHLKDFSVEQYFGNQPSVDGKWSKGVFTLPGHAAVLDYYDYVRTRLAVGELKYKPVEEMRNMMTSLCQDLQDRALAVQNAVAKGLPHAAHPARLPTNIYGTDGDWETFSTPSRDARLKTSFLELFTSTQKFVELYNQHDPRIEYVGNQLGQDLRDAYAAAAASCTIQYQNSAGQNISVSYDTVASRLFQLSFDPYHCPEYRWGASGAEALSCDGNQDKLNWFTAEQRLRNQVERTYSAKMNFDIQELLSSASGSGVDKAPSVDLKAYLQTLK